MFQISRYLSFSRMTAPLEVSKPFYHHEDDGVDITKLSSAQLIQHIKEHPPKITLSCKSFHHALVKDRVFVRLKDSHRLVKLTESAGFCIEAGRLAFKIDNHAREMCTWDCGGDLYEKDAVTHKQITNERLATVIIKHLLYATQFPAAFNAIACAVKMIYLTASVSFNVTKGIYQVTKATFTLSKSPLEEGFWQSQARDIARIVQAPFLLIGLMLTPFYGLLNPYGGRRLYNDLNECLYDDFAARIKERVLKNSAKDQQLENLKEQNCEKEDTGLTYSSFLEKISTLAFNNSESSFSFTLKESEVKISVENGAVVMNLNGNITIYPPTKVA